MKMTIWNLSQNLLLNLSKTVIITKIKIKSRSCKLRLLSKMKIRWNKIIGGKNRIQKDQALVLLILLKLRNTWVLDQGRGEGQLFLRLISTEIQSLLIFKIMSLSKTNKKKKKLINYELFLMRFLNHLLLFQIINRL